MTRPADDGVGALTSQIASPAPEQGESLAPKPFGWAPPAMAAVVLLGGIGLGVFLHFRDRTVFTSHDKRVVFGQATQAERDAADAQSRLLPMQGLKPRVTVAHSSFKGAGYGTPVYGTTVVVRFTPSSRDTSPGALMAVATGLTSVAGGTSARSASVYGLNVLSSSIGGHDVEVALGSGIFVEITDDTSDHAVLKALLDGLGLSP